MNKKDKIKDVSKSVKEEGMSRRDALRKIGYAAFASSTMLLLLNNSAKARQDSPGGPGGEFPWDDEDNDWD